MTRLKDQSQLSRAYPMLTRGQVADLAESSLPAVPPPLGGTGQLGQVSSLRGVCSARQDGQSARVNMGPAATMQPNEAMATGGLAADPAGAHVAWGPCRATARTGRPCRAEGSGLGGLCRHHGGLALRGGWKDPLPIWTVVVAAGGCHVAPSRAARTWPAAPKRWPQRVRPWIALRLVASGQVTRGVFHRHEGSAFLAELVRCGVRVLDEGQPSALRRRVRFEVEDIQRSKALARRPGMAVQNG
jgi:hypothetical protein